MTKHSVAEAKNKLPQLLDRALKGEEVVITRHGHPIAEIRALPSTPKKLTNDELDWLAARRAGRGRATEDAGVRVSRMRDEDWR